MRSTRLYQRIVDGKATNPQKRKEGGAGWVKVMKTPRGTARIRFRRYWTRQTPPSPAIFDSLPRSVQRAIAGALL